MTEEERYHDAWRRRRLCPSGRIATNPLKRGLISRRISSWSGCRSSPISAGGMAVARIVNSCNVRTGVKRAMVSTSYRLSGNGRFWLHRDTALQRKVVLKTELVSVSREVAQHVFVRGEDAVVCDLIVPFLENLCYERLMIRERRDDVDMRWPVGPSL